MKTKKIIEGEYIILGKEADYDGSNVYRIDLLKGRWAVISRTYVSEDSYCHVWKEDTLASFMKRCESVFEESRRGERAYRVIDLSNGMISDRVVASMGLGEFVVSGEFLLHENLSVVALRAPSENIDSEILRLQSEILLDYDLDASYLNEISESNLDKAVEELNETEL